MGGPEWKVFFAKSLQSLQIGENHKSKWGGGYLKIYIPYRCAIF